MQQKKLAWLAGLLFIVVLVFALMPPPISASPGNQMWYLTDNITGVPTGANYITFRDSGNGTSDSLVIDKNNPKIWASNEAASASLDMSGSWSVTLRAQGVNPAATSMTVEIGTLSSGTFSSKGSYTQAITTTWTTYTFTVTTTGHSISVGDRLAVKISTTTGQGVLRAHIDVHDTVNSPCFITSPAAAPDYPGTGAIIISFTVTDYGNDGIKFGSLDPGMIDRPADQTPTQGAVTLTVGSDTNVAVNVQLKGDDFTGPGTISISNVKYNNSNDPNSASTMGNTYATTWYTVDAYAGDTHQCYHWISIPAGKPPGAYTSTFYYQAIQQ